MKLFNVPTSEDETFVDMLLRWTSTGIFNATFVCMSLAAGYYATSLTHTLGDDKLPRLIFTIFCVMAAITGISVASSTRYSMAQIVSSFSIAWATLFVWSALWAHIGGTSVIMPLFNLGTTAGLLIIIVTIPFFLKACHTT